MYRISSGTGALVGLAAFLLVGLQAQPPKHSVLDRVYSDAQAARGELAYSKTCAECHDLSFDGTPVDGQGFIDNWREFPLQTLYDYIATTMPEDRPGELGQDGYRDVLAYILRRNGYPSGQNDLTADTIKSTAMVGLDGPKPLASEMMVQVVGCVAPAPENTWELVQAGGLARVRKPDPASPDQLKSAALSPLGADHFKLLNLDNLDSKINPESLKGQRVLLKGVYVKDSYGARISALTLQSLGVACAH